MQPHDDSASTRRLDWVDVAKGLCMIAVVALWVGRQMQWEAGWINHFEAFARPFRMPDFFLLSGLFVGAVLQRPWRSYVATTIAMSNGSDSIELCERNASHDRYSVPSLPKASVGSADKR